MLNVLFSEVCTANRHGEKVLEMDEGKATGADSHPFWGSGLCRGIPAEVRAQQDDPRLDFCRIRRSDPQGSQSCGCRGCAQGPAAQQCPRRRLWRFLHHPNSLPEGNKCFTSS